MNAAPVGPPVDRDALRRELSRDRYVTSAQGIEIYLLDARESPAVMDEIGRISEIEFRQEGGGTGKALDIDRHDREPPTYRQLVAWDPDESEIVSMYRFLPGWIVDRERYAEELATGHLFTFSDRFLDEYLPHTIELGRSVVNRSARRRLKGLFAVWAGLGTLVREYDRARFFFGKVTMYEQYDREARTILHTFLRAWFADSEGLVHPRDKHKVKMETANEDLRFGREDFEVETGRLVDLISQRGEMVPPLIHGYMRLTREMKLFGTACNPRFGEVEETAILVPIGGIGGRMRKMFIDSYESVNPDVFLRALQR